MSVILRRRSSSGLQGWSAALIALCAAVLVTHTQAHPYHTSFAEIDWSQDQARLEVSLRVLPEDLETALTWQAGDRVVLRDHPEIRAAIEAYLRARFEVYAPPATAPFPLQLVGLDIGYEQTWLYFTVTASPDDRLRLRNRVLLEVDSSQANRIRALWAEPGDAILMSAAQPEVLLWPGRAE